MYGMYDSESWGYPPTVLLICVLRFKNVRYFFSPGLINRGARYYHPKTYFAKTKGQPSMKPNPHVCGLGIKTKKKNGNFARLHKSCVS